MGFIIAEYDPRWRVRGTELVDELYAAVDLAAAVDDIAVYTDIKDPVVDLVIVMAETWATRTGWSPETI